jgi:FkbM family methyltransferase
MDLDVEVAGRPVHFECENSIASAWVCRFILEGVTYPNLPFVEDVRVVLDVGANCGAASVYLAAHHPDATVHAFEPASGPRAICERNVADHPNITVHPFGLHDHDAELALHHAPDSIMGSVVRPSEVGTSEPVRVRRGETWAREQGIDRVDVLKVDVEGCELEVLDGLGDLVGAASVIYVEYDSRVARREIEARLAPTHELYFAPLQALDQGEAIYLAKRWCDVPGATEELSEIFARLRKKGLGG